MHMCVLKNVYSLYIYQRGPWQINLKPSWYSCISLKLIFLSSDCMYENWFGTIIKGCYYFVTHDSCENVMTTVRCKSKYEM